jgi:hypothetical protein
MNRFALSAAFTSTRAPLALAVLFFASIVAACSAPSSKAPDAAPGAASSSAASAPAAGAFEGTITAKMDAGQQGMQMTYMIKGPNTRIETGALGAGAPKAIVLMDMKSGSQTVLMPERKSYMTSDFKGLAEKMGQAAGLDPKEFKATTNGKTETIAGFKCQHWLIGEKQDADLCMAQGLGYFGGAGGNGLFDQFQSLAFGDKNKEILDANPEFAAFIKGGAFPLKISQVEGGESKTIMEVTSVERKTLDDALFSVPSDYKKLDIPKFPMGKQ